MAIARPAGVREKGECWHQLDHDQESRIVDVPGLSA